MFSVYINVILVSLRHVDLGCHIQGEFYGCFLHADDIIILSPSVIGLQNMLNNCLCCCDQISLKFNFAKSHCIAFGKSDVNIVSNMTLDGHSIPWVNSKKYLGVHIVGGAKISFDINFTKRMFYSSFNTILAKAKSLCELVQLNLFESYCLPLLTYAAGAISLNNKQIHDLNVCWNTVYRVTFGFNRWTSVRNFIAGLGKLNLEYILLTRKVKFYYQLKKSYNKIFSHLFWIHFADNYSNDRCLKLLNGRLFDTVDALREQFTSNAELC